MLDIKAAHHVEIDCTKSQIYFDILTVFESRTVTVGYLTMLSTGNPTTLTSSTAIMPLDSWTTIQHYSNPII
jgi:hypothetical protein